MLTNIFCSISHGIVTVLLQSFFCLMAISVGKNISDAEYPTWNVIRCMIFWKVGVALLLHVRLWCTSNWTLELTIIIEVFLIFTPFIAHFTINHPTT